MRGYRAYAEKHFKPRPRRLARRARLGAADAFVLAAANVDYTLVDDNHFLGAGFDLEQLFGYYVARIWAIT